MEKGALFVKEQKAKYGYLFVTPYLLTFLVFQLYPILYSFYLSLTTQVSSKENVFSGFKNYIYLVQDKVFWKSIGNTCIIWLGGFVPQIIFALLLAVLLSQYHIKAASFLRAAYYLPNLVTAASIGILFSVLFDWQTGTVNKILLQVGFIKESVHWMSIPFFARSITSFIQWWMWFGYSAILLTASIKAISPEVLEASIVDGANNRQRLFKITLPLLKPTLLYVMVTSLIGGMQIFDIPMTLTGGTGEPQKSLLTMVLYLYNSAFTNRNYAYGATVSYGLFFVILIFSLVFYRILYPSGKKEGLK